jgi:hypothetical protein
MTLLAVTSNWTAGGGCEGRLVKNASRLFSAQSNEQLPRFLGLAALPPAIAS